MMSCPPSRGIAISPSEPPFGMHMYRDTVPRRPYASPHSDREDPIDAATLLLHELCGTSKESLSKTLVDTTSVASHTSNDNEGDSVAKVGSQGVVASDVSPLAPPLGPTSLAHVAVTTSRAEISVHFSEKVGVQEFYRTSPPNYTCFCLETSMMLSHGTP